MHSCRCHEGHSFACQTNTVRGILLRRQQLGEIELARREKSAFPNSRQSLLQNACTHATTPSDRLAWLIDIDMALAIIGHATARILVYRLLRRAKSAEGSWDQIAHDTGIPASECRQRFQIAIPIFLAEIDIRHIPDSPHGEPISPTPAHPKRCASKERGGNCVSGEVTRRAPAQRPSMVA